MANFGFRFRIQNRNNQRSWTETFYRFFGDVTIDANIVRLGVTVLGQRRAGCLARNNTLVDVTVFDPANIRRVITYPLNLPGDLGNASDPAIGVQDIAPAAILIKCSGVSSQRYYLMRGVADADVREGNFEPDGFNIPKYNTWINSLRSQPLQLLKRPQARPPMAIQSVGSLGLNLVTSPATIIPKGSQVRISTAISGNGPKVYTSAVTKDDSTTTFVPIEWTRGNCTGGFLTVLSREYQDIVATAISVPARTRKTGGPLGKFRGRR